MSAGALSRWILWNKPTLKASIDDYKKTKLNSIRDDNIFDINSVKVLYGLPEKSFTLVLKDHLVY